MVFQSGTRTMNLQIHALRSYCQIKIRTSVLFREAKRFLFPLVGLLINLSSLYTLGNKKSPFAALNIWALYLVFPSTIASSTFFLNSCIIIVVPCLLNPLQHSQSSYKHCVHVLPPLSMLYTCTCTIWCEYLFNDKYH